MDKLQAMHTFVAIVERGSLTAAAGELGRSLPTVVRTLAALEEALGARLLARTTRRIALTEEGRRYLERCRRVLAEVHEAEAELVAGRSEPVGAVSITAPALFGQLHVVPGVAGYLERHRRARVELLLLDRVVNLVEEGVDVAVRIAHLEDSTLIARRAGQIRQVLCASPRYLARAGRPDHPRELERHECVLRSRHDGAASWRFDDGDRRLTVHPEGRFACNTVAGTHEACVAGAGIGRFLSYQVRDAVRAGRLEVLLPAFEPPPIPVSLVHAHARLVPVRVRALVDWLADDLRRRLDPAGDGGH